MNIGKTIKILRIGLQIKQRDFAEKLGVSPNYISLLENNKKEPSLSLLRKVAKALGVPVGFLFINEEPAPRIGKEATAIYEQLKKIVFQVQKNSNEHNSEKAISRKWDKLIG